MFISLLMINACNFSYIQSVRKFLPDRLKQYQLFGQGLWDTLYNK